MWNDLRNYISEVSEQYPNNDEARLLCRRIIDKMDDLANEKIANPIVNRTRIRGNVGEMYLRGRRKLTENLEMLKLRSQEYYQLESAQNVWIKVKNYLPYPYKDSISSAWNNLKLSNMDKKYYQNFTNLIDECIASLKEDE